MFLTRPFCGSEMLTWRRRSKNCGGGIAPAAIGALIEVAPFSVNAFRASRNLEGRPEKLIRC